MSKWPMVQLGDVLTSVSRPEVVRSDIMYRVLGAHWYAEGLYTKETKSGSEIQATKVYRVEEGDFVYNRLFAWKGSFAIATKDNHDCYVSNEFPCFAVNSNRAEGRYLWRYFGRVSAWEEALGLSTGGTPTSRNRLKEQKLLAMEISLPPLPEQRRIVARVDLLAAKIKEARGLRQEAVRDEERLLICMAHREDLPTTGKIRSGWFETTVGSICSFTDESQSVDGSRSYPNLGIYSYGRGVFLKPPIEGAATSAHTLRRIRAGQFIYSRLFAFEGAYAMVPPELDGHYVSGEYPTFTCDPTKACAEFLWAYFRSPNVWQTVAAGSKGLGNRRQRVQPDRVLEHRLWVPPMEWQRKIQSVQAKVDALKELQTDTAAELAALLPSILDKAFKGELVA